MPRHRTLALAIATLLPVLAHGQTAPNAPGEAEQDAPADATSRRHERELEQIVVTAIPNAEPGAELLRPVDVLSGAELEQRRTNTIGGTVAREAGVQSGNFGPGVGRPIIRGLEGARVQVLQSGVSSLDVSTVSADHAVTIEPFLADQIEILKGPSTLLFGTGAIGGVVNMVDGRIAETPVDGFGGRAELHGNTVNNERAGMVRLDAGNGAAAMHFDYVRRDGDDFDLPDGTLLNSAIDQTFGAAGAGYAFDAGFLGVSISRYDSLYGIPFGPSNAEPEKNEEPKEVRLDQEQTRVDVRGGIYSPWSWLDKLSFRFADNDYEHVELADGEVGTRFTNDAWEGRIEAVHAELGGWTGAFGYQASSRDFAAIGAEAFVPPTTTDDWGVFLIERREFAPFEVELGARYDSVESETDTGLSSDHSPVSLSAAGLWRFSDSWHASLNLDRAQRAPVAEELYSDGPHEATGSFEIGDADLDQETAQQIEVGLHYHQGTIEAKLAAYYNRFNDFIYLAETGEVDPEEGLPIRLWTQDDAEFRGVEGELRWRFAENASGEWQLRAIGDLVEGELRDGGNLPRIAPARLGAELNWDRGPWRASLGAIHYFEQDDVAEFEQPTSGFTLVDAHVSYAFDVGSTEWEAFLDGSNLGDTEARWHTSLLRDRSPVPGLGVQFGLRTFF